MSNKSRDVLTVISVKIIRLLGAGKAYDAEGIRMAPAVARPENRLSYKGKARRR